MRAIHAQNRAAHEGVAGQRCALNLSGGIAKDEIARGDMVLDPTLHAPTERIDALFRLLPLETKPLALWTPVRLHHAATDVAARIVPLSEDAVAPGNEGFVQLVLEKPIPAAVGDRFVLRDTTAQRTLGGGSLVDLRAPGRKRRTPERLAQLEVYALGNPTDVLPALLARSPFYVDLVVFARDRAIASAQASAMAARLGLVTVAAAGREFALTKPAWERYGASVVAALAAAHHDDPGVKGVGIERLRTRVEPLLPMSAFMPFLQRLAKGGSVALDGAAVRLARHEASLAPGDEKMWAGMLPLLSGAERFRPPRVTDLATTLSLREADIRRLLKLLAKMAKVDEIAPDHFFLRTTVAEMVDAVADLSAKSENGQFSAAEFRDRLDNGRKVAIQILEFFDRHSVTVRRGDLRRLNEARRDLYRPSGGAPAAA